MAQGMTPGTSNEDGDRRHLGLGLYTIEKIVTAHGGRMRLAPSAEEGTTFVLRLPRADTNMQ